MNSTINAISILLIVFIVAIPIFILFYNRYLNNFKNQIDTFLQSNNLTFTRTLKPRKSDWERSPFDRPSPFSFSLGRISLGGMTTSFSETKYVIIETKQGSRIWLEIQTTFLFKPKLNFKYELLAPSLRKTDGKITFECPACKYVLFETDEICPDCGLHLK